MNRSALLDFLVERIAGVVCPHAVRVAIDGVDGVGKTTLAEELAGAMSACGRQVIRASVDGFHNPRRIRYRLGRNSPEGYFRDSFDYAALIAVLLAPLGPGGTRRFRRAVFDYRIDAEVEAPAESADDDAILLFDGVFLHRPELLPYWDVSLFLDAPFEVTIQRAATRDGGSSSADAPDNRRYVEGQKLYLQACEPRRTASIVIDYERLSFPEVVKE